MWSQEISDLTIVSEMVVGGNRSSGDQVDHDGGGGDGGGDGGGG